MKLNLILGAGTSGLSIAKLLLEKGEAVLIADDRLTELPASFLDYPLCLFYQRGLKLDLAKLEYKRVIKSPGLPNTHPLVEKLSENYPMLSDIEVAYQFAQDLTFVGITGSNGKTTVTSLLAHLGAPDIVTAGNIGIPLGDVVVNETNKIVALELSSFQLEGIQTFKPKVATILNLSPDHLDRYSAEESYYQAKLNIYKNMDKSDIFFRNNDDIILMKKLKDLDLNIIDFSIGLDTKLHIQHGHVCYEDVKLFDIKTLKIKGLHNLSNAMVAAGMAYMLGISLKQIQDRLQTFGGVEHRLEFVKSVSGVDYYNDSKATNPEATEVALKAFDGNNIHLILGGYDKQIPFDLLKKYESKCKMIYGFGETKEKIKQVFDNTVIYKTLDEVMEAVKSKVESGDIVLFSPACASYDQYENFEQRGRHFKSLV